MSALLKAVTHYGGEGVHQAWRPFAYANQKDTAAAQYTLGALLHQRMQQLEASGVPISDRDKALVATYQSGGPAAMWRQGIQGHPIVQFGMETAFSPSTLLSMGAAAAPETIGAKALIETPLAGERAAPSILRGARPILRGPLAGPAIEPFARGAVTALNLPRQLARASNAERLGMLARGGDRFMALPFEVILSALRQSREGSLLRKLPAFEHLFSMDGPTMAKLAARNIGNRIMEAEMGGVSLERALGLADQEELPGFSGPAPTGPPGAPPTGNNPGAVAQTLLPGVTPNPAGQVRVGGNFEHAPERAPLDPAAVVRQPGFAGGRGDIVGDVPPAPMESGPIVPPNPLVRQPGLGDTPGEVVGVDTPMPDRGPNVPSAAPVSQVDLAGTPHAAGVDQPFMPNGAQAEHDAAFFNAPGEAGGAEDELAALYSSLSTATPGSSEAEHIWAQISLLENASPQPGGALDPMEQLRAQLITATSDAERERIFSEMDRVEGRPVRGTNSRKTHGWGRAEKDVPEAPARPSSVADEAMPWETQTAEDLPMREGVQKSDTPPAPAEYAQYAQSDEAMPWETQTAADLPMRGDAAPEGAPPAGASVEDPEAAALRAAESFINRSSRKDLATYRKVLRDGKATGRYSDRSGHLLSAEDYQRVLDAGTTVDALAKQLGKADIAANGGLVESGIYTTNKRREWTVGGAEVGGPRPIKVQEQTPGGNTFRVIRESFGPRGETVTESLGHGLDLKAAQQLARDEMSKDLAGFAAATMPAPAPESPATAPEPTNGVADLPDAPTPAEPTQAPPAATSEARGLHQRDEILSNIESQIEFARTTDPDTGRKGGYGRINHMLNQAGIPDSDIPTYLVRLFGNVKEGSTDWIGTGDWGYGLVKDAEKARNTGLARGVGKDEIEKLEAAVDAARKTYARTVLANQSDERLHDLLEYAYSRAHHTPPAGRVLIGEDHPLIDGFKALDHPDDIKLRVQAANHVGQFKSTVGGGSDAPPDALFQKIPGEDQPIQHHEIDLPDRTIEGLRAYKTQLTEALEQYKPAKRSVDSALREAMRQFPDLGDLMDGTADEALAKISGRVPDAVYEPLAATIHQWQAIGIDLLRASKHQAIGVATMVKVAREMAPEIFEPRGKSAQFWRSTLPAMWKEQALLAPRFPGGNLLDVVSKSLMHGEVPMRRPTLAREGKLPSRIGMPTRLSSFFRDLGLPIPSEVTDTFRETLVGDDRAYVTKGKEGSSYRHLWEHYNPIAWVSEANLALNSSIEQSARTSIVESTMRRGLIDRGPETVSKLLARLAPEINPSTEEQIMRLFASRRYVVSGEEARVFLKNAGVRDRVNRDFVKHWRNMLSDLTDEGVAASNHIHFDYADRNNLDRFVSKVMPFHFWASRNLPFYMEHLAEKPALAVAWSRYNRIAEEERKRKHLPGRFSGFLSLGGNGIIGGLFGVPGMLAADPSQFLSVTGQVNPGQSYSKEGESGIGRGLDTLKQYTGLGPGPLADFALNATGAYGKSPMDPNLLRLGPLIDAGAHKLGVPSPNWLASTVPAEGAAAIRGTLRRWDTRSLSGSQYRDRLIRQRIAELSVEEGRGPNDAKYVMAMNDPHNPIWGKAAGQVERMLAAQNLLSSTVPVSTKFGTDTATAIQAARDAQPRLPEGLTPDQRKRIEAQQQAADPSGVAMAGAYDAVGAMGSSPALNELKKEMVLYEVMKKQADAAPTKAARAGIYDGFFTRFPLLRTYFDWSAAEKRRGANIPPGEGFERFLDSQRQTGAP